MKVRENVRERRCGAEPPTGYMDRNPTQWVDLLRFLHELSVGCLAPCQCRFSFQRLERKLESFHEQAAVALGATEFSVGSPFDDHEPGA